MLLMLVWSVSPAMNEPSSDKGVVALVIAGGTLVVARTYVTASGMAGKDMVSATGADTASNEVTADGGVTDRVCPEKSLVNEVFSPIPYDCSPIVGKEFARIRRISCSRKLLMFAQIGDNSRSAGTDPEQSCATARKGNPKSAAVYR